MLEWALRSFRNGYAVHPEFAVPEMLKEEPFYNDVFYNHINSETVFDWLDSMINVA